MEEGVYNPFPIERITDVTGRFILEPGAAGVWEMREGNEDSSMDFEIEMREYAKV